jgi:hypothetical protein
MILPPRWPRHLTQVVQPADQIGDGNSKLARGKIEQLLLLDSTDAQTARFRGVCDDLTNKLTLRRVNGGVRSERGLKRRGEAAGAGKDRAALHAIAASNAEAARAFDAKRQSFKKALKRAAPKSRAA